MMLVIMIGWVFFRSDTLAFAGSFIGQMFSFRGSTAGYSVLSYLSLEIIIALVCGIVFSGALQRLLAGPFSKIKDKKFVKILEYVFLAAIFVLSLIKIVGGSYAPSIYQNF